MKPSSLIKSGKADAGYHADDYMRDQFTAVATFRTALGEHRISMCFPHKMLKYQGPEGMKGIMIRRVNRFVHKDLFGRAFNMVKRLRRKV